MSLLMCHYTHVQMDKLSPTDKLSPMALAVMSQLGSLATTGLICVTVIIKYVLTVHYRTMWRRDAL